MEENHQQQKLYSFFQTGVYLFIFLDIYLHLFSHFYKNAIATRLHEKLYQVPFLYNPIWSHITIFSIIVVISLAAKAKKNLQFSVYKHFIYPFLLGAPLFILSAIGFYFNIPNERTVEKTTITMYAFAGCYVFGALLIQVSFSNLTKHFRNRLKNDIWNEQEESFAQNKTLVQNEYMFNVPIQFYYQKKLQNGWMNIQPFRGCMVLGVPGSGKTESIIVPYIKHYLSKGFAMLVYDFKFPTLAKITYYHYLRNLANGGPLANFSFHTINMDQLEYSQCINPIDSRYIKSLADAGETAEAFVIALKKGDKPSGNDQFFTQSAINFLAACMYFLAKHEKGKYSTLGHLIALVGLPYNTLFQHLFSNIELHSLLAPFASAFQNKAFEQLEGQIGSLRIQLSRLATKETFWVFGKSDFDLKISNPPSIVVLANSPDSQNVNSAFFAAILQRTIRLVNSPGNNPCAIVVDEQPTLYMHKLDNLIATARSNKVAVIIGLQELAMLQQQQGKETAATISAIMGTVISGAVRSKETLDWLERLFGKIKQVSQGLNVDRSRTGINLNERMDTLIPASKIANQNTGEVVALVSRDNSPDFQEYQSNAFRCKVIVDLEQLKEESKHYVDMPKYYDFGSEEEKEQFLLENLKRIYKEIEDL
ncbi:type IV secretory system conjugative DNA transfer family protein [Niabella sp. CJ426]|uniref:type IV secretory system conjugative DNA transfer family protein n=1 Tax=Niabella sp. CJ426 TaxID=3393740 RepID=UPI003CFE8238